MCNSDLPDSNRSAASFLATLIAFLGLLLAVPAMLIAAVDPTGLVHAAWPSAPKLCAKGVQAGHRQAVGFLAHSVQPREVIFGNSRVIHGFGQADAEARLSGPVVNMALPGARFVEVDALLRASLETGRLKRVWIALEPGMFFGDASRDRDLGLILPRGDQALWRAALEHGVFALEPAKRTLTTILKTSKCASAYISPEGFLQERIAALGPGAFAEAVERVAVLLVREAAATPDGLYRERMARFQSVVTALADKNVAVVVFVPPMHIAMRERLTATPWSDAATRWVGDVEDVVRRAKGARFFDLGRLAGPVAACASGDSNCIYYDPLHFRPALGAAMLETMLAERP